MSVPLDWIHFEHGILCKLCYHSQGVEYENDSVKKSRPNLQSSSITSLCIIMIINQDKSRFVCITMIQRKLVI